MKFETRCLLLCLGLLVSSTGLGYSEGHSKDSGGSKGYKSVLMGHSFFRPMANSLEEHAHTAGFTDHRTTLVFRGSAGGAPINLWNNANTRKKGLAALDEGDVEMLGLTAFPYIPGLTKPEVEAIEGYKNWVDYAYKANTGLKRVFIAVPWDLLYMGFKPLEARETEIKRGIAVMHRHIDTLRKLYPTVDFQCIPYGLGAIRLEEALKAGTLSGVKYTLPPNKESKRESIYRDSKGHGGPILAELSNLIWLNAIYGVDLKNDYSDYVSEYDADMLKQIALQVMAEHEEKYEVTSN